MIQWVLGKKNNEISISPMVLEPDLDLGGRQPDDGGQVFAFGRRQIALLPEPPLQLVCLRLREEHSPLALLVPVVALLLGLLLIHLLLGIVRTRAPVVAVSIRRLRRQRPLRYRRTRTVRTQLLMVMVVVIIQNCNRSMKICFV